MRGRPSWYIRSLPNCSEHQAGLPAYCKRSTGTKRSNAKGRMVQVQIKDIVQALCSSAEPRCFNERLNELKITPVHWSRGRIFTQGVLDQSQLSHAGKERCELYGHISTTQH
ncbi:hypothetical protein F511_43378 [Dorcoceras hygrometricum]|uniref:Uncharacterized protein n=1 Tax=Dorcoceras hygrometricum TaxID=472368 RepID=A0A2Z7BZP8_9LAMI|nr:hypothetical protein F511_43378 [Dorcoceras hygrometricum]